MRRLLNDSAIKKLDSAESSGGRGRGGGAKRFWLRGEVCPLDVDSVALEREGTVPVDCTKVSKEVERVMEFAGGKMFHPEGKRLYDRQHP